jgi:xylulokinase
MSLLAIDMGSSSCKAVVFALNGRVLAQASQSYTPNIPQPSWAEMQPEIFWRAFSHVTQVLAQDVKDDPIEALGISSHAETVIAVDEDNRPVSPAILNMDNRSIPQAAWLKKAIDPRCIFEITGLSVHPMYPVPKILWMREHQPEIFRRACQFLAVPSYLLARLGLPVCVDYSLASRFLAFDVRRKSWSGEILAACDLSADRLPEPAPAGTVAGHLSSYAASDLGLQPGTPVVLGGHDQPSAALGMGVIDSGRVSASLGTYECLLAASEQPAINDSAYAANLNTYCHVVPARYVTLAYFPAGIMLDWFLHLFQDVSRAENFSLDSVYAALEVAAPTETSGLLITPHLLGTCNPDFDPEASGVISGLRPATSAAHIYKGILEGIACEFASMAELLQRVTGPFHDVYITGGGCRSSLGLQLRAAISDCHLHRIRGSEAVCLGTAILAGVGAGKYPGFSQAITQLVSVADTVTPDPQIALRYGDQLRRYRLLYSNLAPLRHSAAPSASREGQ